jgi:hypothetical protein
MRKLSTRNSPFLRSGLPLFSAIAQLIVATTISEILIADNIQITIYLSD